MRNICTLLLILIASSANAQLTNGLIGHWNFNGNASDASGNGLHGTQTNITYTLGKTGVANTAASFNGTSSVITVPYDSKMNPTKLSICAMVKFNNFYSGSCQHSMILQRGSFFTSGSYSLSIFENAYDGDCNKYDSTKMVFHQKIANCESGVTLDSFKHNPNVNKNQWYCVIATYDSSRIKIYVDGVQKISYSSNKPFGTSTQGLAIGANVFNQAAQYPYWLNGSIDDLRLYNRVLTPSEINSFCGLFDTTIVIKDSIAKKNICMDDTFHLSYTVTDLFKTGNVFTAQLSDASGNFNTPVNIGTLTSTTNGSIVCNVPTGLTPGNGYRVRIVSTNPVRTSDVTSPIGIYSTLIPSVTIIATPSGPFAPNQFITFVSIPVNAGTTPAFQWYRNGNPIPGANDDSLYINTLNDGDSIYVVVTSSNPCPPDLSAQSNKIHVSINSSVNDIQLPNLNLYPNPNNGSFTVSANSILYNDVLLEIINPLGQVITRKQISVTNKTLQERIETGQISSGIYLLRISADGKQRNIRFTVNN